MHPDHRSRGVRARLLRVAREWAREAGATNFELDTGIERKDARRFLRTSGRCAQGDQLLLGTPVTGGPARQGGRSQSWVGIIRWVSALAAKRLGSGPEVVLVHGGARPELTWERQDELAEEFTLVVPWRRGYPPNPRVERQDWEADAEDLLALAGERSHLVGFSYGGLGAAVAAEREPARFRSLTLIEVPLWRAAAGDPEVDALVELSERFAATVTAGETPPAEFLELAGVAPEASPRAATELAEIVEITRGMRSPAEADVDLRALGRDMPSLVVSGDHSPGIERLCDVVAAELGSERVVLPGAGHAVPRAPGFDGALTRFLKAAA